MGLLIEKENGLGRVNENGMKWKNIDIGASCYFITGTFTEWLPLMNRDWVRKIVAQEITLTMKRHNAELRGYVLMPDHLHMLVYLPDKNVLHDFLKCWRGRTARLIIDQLKREADQETLRTLAEHANVKSTYALWKEQPRSLPVTTEKVYLQKMDYMHNNPVEAKLVTHPADWPYSSYRFYEFGEPGILEVTP